MGDDLDSLDTNGTEAPGAYLGSALHFEDAVLSAIMRFYKDNPDKYTSGAKQSFDILRAEVHAEVVNPPRVTDYKVVVGPKR
ncbi:MAG TPA: hypothetical protein VH950_06620 [Gaiellaceae bacterium]|jgi:hypothetical protein